MTLKCLPKGVHFVLATMGLVIVPCCWMVVLFFKIWLHIYWFNSLRPRQNARRFADATFKHIFVNENVRIFIEISLKFVPKVPINSIPALVQLMAWRRPGDKPLSEPMMVCLPTHICICVTRPQWVKGVGALTCIWGDTQLQCFHYVVGVGALTSSVFIIYYRIFI